MAASSVANHLADVFGCYGRSRGAVNPGAVRRLPPESPAFRRGPAGPLRVSLFRLRSSSIDAASADCDCRKYGSKNWPPGLLKLTGTQSPVFYRIWRSMGDFRDINDPVLTTLLKLLGGFANEIHRVDTLSALKDLEMQIRSGCATSLSHAGNGLAFLHLIANGDKIL